MLELCIVFRPAEKLKGRRDCLFRISMHAYVCINMFFAYFVDNGPMGPGKKRHHSVIILVFPLMTITCDLCREERIKGGSEVQDKKSSEKEQKGWVVSCGPWCFWCKGVERLLGCVCWWLQISFQK